VQAAAEVVPAEKEAAAAATVVEEQAEEAAVPRMPVVDVKVSLRRLGEPVTLFGEDDEHREGRLRRAEQAAQAARRQAQQDAEETVLRQQKAANAFPTPEAEEQRFDVQRTSSLEAIADVVRDSGKPIGELRSYLTDAAIDSHKDDPAVAVAAHRYAFAHLRLWQAVWRLRLGDFGGDPRRAPLAVREHVSQGRDLAPLMSVIESQQCPPNILKTLVDVFTHVDRGDFLAAENAYFNLALGGESWRLGIYGGTMHESAKTQRLYRGAVKHVMNNDVVRAAMVAVKRLVTEAHRHHTERCSSNRDGLDNGGRGTA